jgi:hypothetical protein
MAAQFRHTQIIDRSLTDVFHFYADDHVRNHPRWDPDIELEQQTLGPIGVGTIIRRRNRRSGIPVEGTMEVVEYEPNRSIAMLIHDGAVEMYGRTTFEAVNPNQTLITTFFEIPGMDENMDKSFLNERLEQSGRVRKQLMETEIQSGWEND